MKQKTNNNMNRPNKLAYGMSKTLDRQRKNRNFYSTKEDVLKLAVRGTLDHLSRTNYKVKKAKIESKIDKGYFKEAFILTDSGKKRLETCKNLKRRGLPFWEYMYKKSHS